MGRITRHRLALMAALALGAPSALAQSPATPRAQPQAAAPVAAGAVAPAEPLPYPAATVFPWRTPGIDPAELGASRRALNDSVRTFASGWLTAPPRTLTEIVQGRRDVTLNARRLIDGFLTGTPKTPLAGPPLALEPVWCSVADRQVFALAVADARTNRLLAAPHATLTTAAWRKLRQSPTATAAWLSGRLADLGREGMTAAAARAARQPADALHVGLALQVHNSRVDEGSSLCLNLLLEHQLAESLTVARQLGTDHLATMRDHLGQPSGLRRPTRGYLLAWQWPGPSAGAKPGARVLPATVRVTMRRSETVFGHPLAGKIDESLTLNADGGGRIGLAVPAALTALLQASRDGLRLADWPQAARVDRAWVYLDRGRAWGLRMNDRLETVIDGKPVKGHVVRFFGPEAGLKSPRGHAIEEGAILFVRLGQDLAKVGAEFRFDARTYPTPWPPPAAGSAGR